MATRKKASLAIELDDLGRPARPTVPDPRKNWKQPSQMSGYAGGLNRSTQHSARTHLSLKTKAKIAPSFGSVGTLPWVRF